KQTVQFGQLYLGINEHYPQKKEEKLRVSVVCAQKFKIKISSFLWIRGFITRKIDNNKFVTKGNVPKEKLYTYTLDRHLCFMQPVGDEQLEKMLMMMMTILTMQEKVLQQMEIP
uniref:Uncharacterized protein n=1 Tax=Romanomermis culicivorax TaxID=13658 RepID=A0A915KQ02_ROMCU